MTKRILSLLLAAMMVLGSLVVVSAADEPDYAAENTWAVEVLTKLNVLQGDENGDPMLDNAILRYEMALFLARALTAKTDDAYWAKVENETPFDDLLTHPYNGAATWNYNHGIILGVTDTIFNPNGNITYQDAIVMVVRAWADHFVVGGLEALGIKDELHYPWKHIELADDLGLTANIDPTEKYLENTTRGVVAQLVYNLLTWKDFDNLPAYIERLLKDDVSIGQRKFGLVISAKTGDDFTATEIKDGKVTLDGEKNDLKLAETEFARFNLTAKKDAVYTIVYYTIGNETVVSSIKQKSIDANTIVNTPADRNFEITFVVTDATKDKKDEEKLYNVDKLVVGETSYILTGEKKNITLTVAGQDISSFATADLTPAQVAEYKLIVDSLYGALKLTDKNGEGKITAADITPYVFAAVYAEKDTTPDDAAKEATTWEFAGYAVVPVTEATKTTTDDYTTRTWTWEVKKENGTDKEDKTFTGSAEYVVKSTVTALATATKLSAVKVNYFDVDEETEDKWIKFVDDTTEYGWGYADLLAWDIMNGEGEGVATYFDLARVYDNEATYLLELFENKNVADKDLTSADLKYVNVWVIDGNIVALEAAKADGTSGETPSTPTAVYNGIVLLDELDASDFDIEKDTIKLVNNKYYLAITANVDGVEKDVLVFLADKTGFKFDKNNTNSEQAQELVYYNTKITDAYATLNEAATSGFLPIVFYTLDVNGNIVLVLDKEVTGENYKKYVAGDFVIKAATGETISGIAYAMDINSSDFLAYTVSKAGKDDEVKFITPVATAETTWIFVGDTIVVKTGAPEYGSCFTVDSANDIVKVDNTYVVFTDDVEGFEYTMFAGASYVIYDGSDARNDKKRDGYLYFDVVDLFTGAEYTMRVDEDDKATLDQLDTIEDGEVKIVAVANSNKHDLLEIYDIKEGAIAAIASLQYGSTAFKAQGQTSLAALEERIAEQYNLTAIAKIQMQANTKNNKLYFVDEDDNTLGSVTSFNANCTYYVFFTPATSSAAANYVVFVCENTPSGI